MKTGITPRWSKIASVWLGNGDGVHCHWCKFMKSEEGEVVCTHPQSRFSDGDRIRSWDGRYCAEQCGYFELQDFYKDDKNLDKITKD